jgi:hypothetical protein
MTSPKTQPRKDPLSYVLIETPIAVVATVSRGHHPSLVSMVSSAFHLKAEFTSHNKFIISCDGKNESI